VLFIEKIIIIIRGIKSCKINKENKHFDHDLKIQEVDELIKLKMAKGESKIKIWTRIFLSEYVKSRLTKPTLIKLFIIPSIENISREVSLNDIFEFRPEISWAKEILLPQIDFPISCIELESK